MATVSNTDIAAVYDAVDALNRAGRSTNTSQVARRAGLPRTRAQATLDLLRAKGHVRDVGKGSAYNWRTTDRKAT